MKEVIDRCCVYWIRLPEHTDIFTEGYVGITNNFDYRLLQHKSSAGNPKQYKNYRTEFRLALSSGNFIATKIVEATREYCLEVEGKLRPDWVVGWNLAKGGSGGFGKHGLTGAPEFKVFTYLKSEVKRNEELALCKEWEDRDTGAITFVNFYRSNKTEGVEMKLPNKGVVSKDTVRFMTRSEMSQETNRVHDLGDGILRSVKDIALLLSIRANTISTNLSRGFSIRQACGLDERHRTVIIDNVEFTYNGNLKDDDINKLKVLVEEGMSIRDISKLLPASESNLSRLISRFNLKRGSI